MDLGRIRDPLPRSWEIPGGCLRCHICLNHCVHRRRSPLDPQELGPLAGAESSSNLKKPVQLLKEGSIFIFLAGKLLEVTIYECVSDMFLAFPLQPSFRGVPICCAK